MNIPSKQPISRAKGSTPSKTQATPMQKEAQIASYRENLSKLSENFKEGNKTNPQAMLEVIENTGGLYQELPEYEKETIRNSMKTEGANSPFVQNLHRQLTKLKNATGEDRINAEFEYFKSVHDFLSALNEPIGKSSSALSISPLLSNFLPLLLFSLMPGAAASGDYEQQDHKELELLMYVLMVITTMVFIYIGYESRKPENIARVKAYEAEQAAKVKAKDDEWNAWIAEHQAKRAAETPAERRKREDDEYAGAMLVQQMCDEAIAASAAQANPD